LMSGAAFGAFTVLIISMRKTSRAPLSEASYGPAGGISRRCSSVAEPAGRGSASEPPRSPASSPAALHEAGLPQVHRPLALVQAPGVAHPQGPGPPQPWTEVRC
jgi:hypothetical protein